MAESALNNFRLFLLMPQDSATTLVMHFMVKRFAKKVITCIFPGVFGAGPGGSGAKISSFLSASRVSML